MAELLPEELLVEILCRLPINSLMLFKCVSKGWHTLISNVCVPKISTSLGFSGFLFKFANFEASLCRARFIGYALYPNGNDCDGYNIRTGFYKSFTSLLPFRQSHRDLVGWCHGLLLFMNSKVPQFYVYNYTTKQCIAIPKAIEHLVPFSAALAFDPCKSLDYKVVRILHTNADSVSDPPLLDIFSSNTGKWVRHKVPIEPPVAYGFPWLKPTIYLDGILYKLSESKHLLCFNLDTISGQAIDLPLENEKECGFIGVSKGRLFYADYDESGLMISIFSLENRSHRGSSFWMLRHCISVHDLFAKNPEAQNWLVDPPSQNLYVHSFSSFLRVYAIHPTEDIVFLGIPRMIMSYHLESNKLEVALPMRMRREIVDGQYTVSLYPPCLVVLKDFNVEPGEFSQLQLADCNDDGCKTGNDIQ